MPKPFPGPQTEEMQAVAKKLGVVLVVPLFEKRAPGLYHNSAVIIDADGAILGTYRKMHIPDDPQFYEKFYFTPGDLGFRAWDTAFGTHRGVDLLGPMVSGRGAIDRVEGAQVLFYPTAIGWLPPEKAAYGSGSIRVGKRFSAAMRWPTGFMWRRRTGGDWNNRKARRGWSSGGRVLWRIRPGRSWRRR